jgi:hypothetical protein
MPSPIIRCGYPDPSWGQLHHHGIRNAAVADLQGGAVLDHVGHILADGLLDGPDGGQANLENRLVVLDQGGDLGDVEVAVAEGEGTFSLTSTITARALRMAAMV